MVRGHRGPGGPLDQRRRLVPAVVLVEVGPGRAVQPWVSHGMPALVPVDRPVVLEHRVVQVGVVPAADRPLEAVGRGVVVARRPLPVRELALGRIVP